MGITRACVGYSGLVAIAIQFFPGFLALSDISRRVYSAFVVFSYDKTRKICEVSLDKTIKTALSLHTAVPFSSYKHDTCI